MKLRSRLRKIYTLISWILAILVVKVLAELRRPEGQLSGAPYPYGKLKETHELIFSWLSWLAVLLVGLRTTTTTATTTVESRKMAAILQIIGWQGHEDLVYSVLLWHWTFMLWSIDTCQNKVSADQYHVTISRAQVYNSSSSYVFWGWPLTKCWFFDWIAGSCQVNLLKTGQNCSEASWR